MGSDPTQCNVEVFFSFFWPYVGVVVEELEAHVAAVRDDNGVGFSGWPWVVGAAVVLHELAVRRRPGPGDPRVET